MKKCILVLSALLTLWAVDASAQLSNGIRYGVVGGFTSTTTTKIKDLKDFKAENVSLYHAGLTVKFNLGAGFAIQPALTYQVKGADLETMSQAESALEGLKEFDAKVGYLELPVQIQWGPDLMALRPFAFVEPFVGYGVNFKANAQGEDDTLIEGIKNEWKNASLKRLEYGMGFGAGIEFFHFQLSAQYFMNFGHLADENGTVDGHAVGQTVLNNFKNKNFQGFKVSLAVLF